MAPFPKLRYPLETHAAENEAEEARCLAEVDSILGQWKEKSPVAAVIVEPILAEGGDRHASPSFFRKLIALSHQHGALFICDEVQTGFGGTGKFWAHEHWDLKEGQDAFPDFVTFSKKAQAAGFFHKKETRPSQPYRNYNTSVPLPSPTENTQLTPPFSWMGAPSCVPCLVFRQAQVANVPHPSYSTLLQCREIINIVRDNKLVEHTAAIGVKLQDALATLFKQAPQHQISNLRGVGTFIAWDFSTPGSRDKFLALMKANGVIMGGCGDQTVSRFPVGGEGLS